MINNNNKKQNHNHNGLKNFVFYQLIKHFCQFVFCFILFIKTNSKISLNHFYLFSIFLHISKFEIHSFPLCSTIKKFSYVRLKKIILSSVHVLKFFLIYFSRHIFFSSRDQRHKETLIHLNPKSISFLQCIKQRHFRKF